MLNLIINKMKKTSMIIVCAMFLFSNMIAQNAKLELEKAQKSGKSIFLVVSTKTSVNFETNQFDSIIKGVLYIDNRSFALTKAITELKGAVNVKATQNS